jgi:hypothetical protein
MSTEKKTQELSGVDAILAQYADNQTNSSSTARKSYDLKNYFSPRLGEREKSGSVHVRILPDANGGTPFKEIYIHKLQIKGEWKKFICLNHNFDKDCPFCEAREALLATGKDSDKELAKGYGARRAYVVKVINRDAEDEGVKFWRFNHDYRNEGIFDKIVGIIKNRGAKGNIADPVTGRDLIIEMGKNQKNATIIKSIVDADPEPLTEDAALSQEWLSDTRTWEDVYSIRNYEYLEIVVRGGEPTWDKANNKWVDKAELADAEASDLDEALTIGSEETSEEATEETTVETSESTEKPVAKKAPKAKKAVVVDSDDDDDDDMPF